MATQLEEKRLSIPRNELELLSIALHNNAAIDVIERLAALQEKAMMRNAELAFNEAMNAAQAEVVRVIPKRDNNQTGSKYAGYDDLDKMIRPVYIKHGFSLSFDTDPSVPPTVEMVRVLCRVSHRDGHTRTYHYDMPADGKGPKGGDVMTKTHARAAAGSYGMRYLLKMIFNIAIGEDDRDGNSQGMDGQTVEDWVNEIHASATLQDLSVIYGRAFNAAQSLKDNNARKIFMASRDDRRAKLGSK